METYHSILMKSTLFRDIKENELSDLLPSLRVKVREYKMNEYVFSLGETVNYIYIVLKGSIKIMKENIAGNTTIVAFLGPSQIFAEGIVCTRKRIAPVSTLVTENAKVLQIPYDQIINNNGNENKYHSHLTRNMMLLLGEKNYSLNNKIDILMLKGMRNKLATFLLNEANKNGSLSFTISPNRNELADYLNVSRTSMCRELSKMKSDGIIDYYKNSFKIMSSEALQNSLQ